MSDDDEYPKIICANCKCQLDMLVKFIDDLLDGQVFLKNIHKVYKSKQFTSAEYNIPLAEERLTTFKNKNNVAEFMCDTCGLTFAHKNDLKTHLKTHRGNQLWTLLLNSVVSNI